MSGGKLEKGHPREYVHTSHSHERKRGFKERWRGDEQPETGE